MTDRLITAPADKVTPLQFFDAVTGSSPAKRAARDEYYRIQREGTEEEKEAYRKAALQAAIDAVHARIDAVRAEALTEQKRDAA